MARWQLERNPCTHLHFAPWRHRHGDCAELRRVDKAVGRSQVRLVQSVESFGTELEIRSFGQAERTFYRKVQRFHSRTIHGVSPYVAVCESRRRRERRGIEPLGGGVSPWTEDGLPGYVCAYRVFS